MHVVPTKRNEESGDDMQEKFVWVPVVRPEQRANERGKQNICINVLVDALLQPTSWWTVRGGATQDGPTSGRIKCTSFAHLGAQGPRDWSVLHSHYDSYGPLARPRPE